MTKRCCKCREIKSLRHFYAGGGRYLKSGNCKPCSKKVSAAWKRAHREVERKRSNDKSLQHRVEVIYHYSRGKNNCNCCGEREFWFLTIDHVDNDGAKHRKQFKRRKTGKNFYAWLKKEGFPKVPRLQVLCANCNHSKAIHGQCVHRLKEVKRWQ